MRLDPSNDNWINAVTPAVIHRSLRRDSRTLGTWLAVAIVLVSIILACGQTSSESESASSASTPAAVETAPASSDDGFPRTITTDAGDVVLEQKPQRIHTLSVGFDEITFALVGADRIAAVGTFTADPKFSNIAEEAGLVANKVGRDVEAIVAARPDIVIAPSSKRRADLVEALRQAGIPVIVTDLIGGVDAHVQNIRFLASIFGEEDRAETIVEVLSLRLQLIDDALSETSSEQRPRVLMLAGDFFVSGAGSTGDSIIRRAGGLNAAAEAGVQGLAQLGVEGIAEMNPEIILLPSVNTTKPELPTEILKNPGLAHVEAVKEGRVFVIKSQWVGTLSHWNVHGVEMLTKLFYPDLFADRSENGFAYEPVKATTS